MQRLCGGSSFPPTSCGLLSWRISDIWGPYTPWPSVASPLSTGAYRIDAHAHRVALAGSTGGLTTVAVMAGGVNRFCPAGNEDLPRAVADHGAVLAEIPPGSAPTRYRFLQRKAKIDALPRYTASSVTFAA